MTLRRHRGYYCIFQRISDGLWYIGVDWFGEYTWSTDQRAAVRRPGRLRRRTVELCGGHDCRVIEERILRWR